MRSICHAKGQWRRRAGEQRSPSGSGGIAASVAILELRVSDDAIASAKPLIQMAATDLRVGSSSAQIAVGGPIIGSANLSQLLDATLTPYVDLIAGTSRRNVDLALEGLKSTAPALRGC